MAGEAPSTPAKQTLDPWKAQLRCSHALSSVEFAQRAQLDIHNDRLATGFCYRGDGGRQWRGGEQAVLRAHVCSRLTGLCGDVTAMWQRALPASAGGRLPTSGATRRVRRCRPPLWICIRQCRTPWLTC